MNRKILWLLVIPLLLAPLFAARQLGTTDDPTPARVNPNAIVTTCEPWYLMRTVTSAETALTGAGKMWSGALAVPVMKAWNTVSLSFLAYGDGDGAGDPNDATIGYTAYMARRGGSLEFVCSGSPTVGAVLASSLPWDETEAAVLDPNDHKWAEGGATLVTAEGWDTPVGYTLRADEVGKVSWDTHGAGYVYVRVTAMTSISTVYVMMTGR